MKDEEPKTSTSRLDDRESVSYRFEINPECIATLTTFLHGVFATVIAIAILGASITFAYVVSDIRPTPDGAKFDKSHCQTFLAISWLLFSLALGISGISASILTFYRNQLENSATTFLWMTQVIIVLLFGLGVSAFMCLSLVVMAYSMHVGLAAVILDATLACGGLLIVIYQNARLWKPVSKLR